MILAVFLFYFLLFVLIFSSPEKIKQKRWKHLFALPAVIALVMSFFTVVKVYFIYKIFLLLFAAITCLLSYWQWGDQIKRWWKN